MKSLALGVIRRIFIEVVGDVGQRIQAREVRGAEDRGFGAPHIWPQNRVHLADGITLGQGIRDSCHKSIGTDAVGDEVGGIFTENHTFAKHFCCELLHKLQQCWIGIDVGNDLQQAHIAHGIEEVRD